ncbi:CoA transferase [Pseudomonadales bacterium]|nr:CoA transferase [Pseudomonadales bacterium]
MSTKPLLGLKVLDLTHVLAGPYCTYQLALLGAEVIKVESPRGDMTRPWGGDEEQIAMGLGTGFVAQNAGKRSVVIDITTERGASLVGELAKQADIFVENYRPGTMQDHGLDYDSLAADNAELIYLSISAFGQNGPMGHRPGFDDVIQATSGFMSINQRGDGPIRTGGPVLDYATGMHSTSAVLAAVLLRQQTGKGQRIDIAMQDVTMLLMNRHTSIAATTGVAVPPGANRDGPMLGRYRAKDGYIMLAGYRASHQRSILKAIGLMEFASFGTAQLMAQMPQIEAKVEEVLQQKTVTQWDVIFSDNGVVAGGVKDLIEVFETGQPEARELTTKVESAYGEHQVTSAGYRINDVTFKPDTHVPLLGEHTNDVLTALGYSEIEIARLAEQHIIASK